MKRNLAALAMFGLATLAQAATYTYTGKPYSTGTITNFTACAVGPCANYTGSMSVNGSFTTASALPPNFSGDISALATSFSFTDGINTYSTGDPNFRRLELIAQTDSLGNIVSSGTEILIMVWQSGSSPHSIGDRVALLLIEATAQSFNNTFCSFRNTSPAGDVDSCVFETPDGSSSVASDGGGVWGPRNIAPSAIPTLAEWAMVLLAGLVALAAAWALRRRGKR